MTLFGIGPMELMIILALALIVLGPNKLPEAARSIGKALNQFRRASMDVTSTVTRELDLEGSPAPVPTVVSAPAIPVETTQVIHDPTLPAVEQTVVEAPAQVAETGAPSAEPEVAHETGVSPESSSEEPVIHD